ncbi:LamG domain-containing protein [Streptomyces yaizuensis]|uniref:LamG domain-containing protein n=1 Tax=Streptomyces yaizuensis TaxID=2989713 RepID=UPI00389A646B
MPARTPTGLPAGPVGADRTDGGNPSVATTDAALAEAKRSGTPVEVASLRSETSDVLAMPQGKLESRIHLRPVRVRTQSGWKPVDTDLTRSPAGRVLPKAATVELEFSGGGSTPLVRMEKAGRELSLSWPDPLPAPELNGPTATYREVLPGVDLRMGAKEDGFTQLLVVKSAEAAANKRLTELRLALGSEGLEVRQTTSGGLTAVDESSQGTVFEAPRPVMWDSSTPSGGSNQPTPATQKQPAGKRAAAFPAGESGATEPGAGDSGKLATVGVELPAAGDTLVLKPDATVLTGPNTVYPVYIDPQWNSPRASSWTMASKYWDNEPQWEFNGKSTEGLGLCNWYYCNPHDTKRLFYQIDTSGLAGKRIEKAEFIVRNTWSASCSARGVELWQTKAINDRTTWNTQLTPGFWIKELASRSFAHGFEGCVAKDAEFDIRAEAQAAANDRTPTMTFGLRAASETDAYAWKRFSDRAHLRVLYNRPPPQIKHTQMFMEYGGACPGNATPARVRSRGTISVRDVTDPDGDAVQVKFQASWDSGDGKGVIPRWTPAWTTKQSSRSTFTIELPPLPVDREVSWYVKSRDGEGAGSAESPWSNAGDPTGCYFIFDNKVPKAPSITSREYPASNNANPQDPWLDGVGNYGLFEIKASDSDVQRYRYGINGNPTEANTLSTSGGAARTIPVLPSRPGLNYVTAQAFDDAGINSEIRTYQFRVRSGQPERAVWAMDEPGQRTEVQGTAGDRSATLHGGATPGVPGAVGTAVSFDGVDDYARTDLSSVATEAAFSVSAWVKLSKLPEGAAVIAAQPGNHRPGFELYYSKSYDRWVFNQYTADTATATPVRAMASTAGGVRAGEWTHLVGTYSQGAGELKLYVQGKLVGTAPHTGSWDARRGFQIGAGSYSGQLESFFPGAIDELRVFDKPLSPTEVTLLHSKQSIGEGRPARAVFPLDEPAGATDVIGRADVDAAALRGGAVTGVKGMDGHALKLDGKDDYAVTTAPHLNNQRGFAVAAWVRLDSVPGQAAIVATQAGTHKSGFELYYSSALNKWVFNQYAADSPEAAPIRAVAEDKEVRAEAWVHLVGVHDTVANRLTLYVNGAEAGRTIVSETWYAGGPVQIGAGSYDRRPGSFFPGLIDDVRLFDRPVSGPEVQALFKQRALVNGRWNFEEVSTGTTVTTPNGLPGGTPLTLRGAARLSDGSQVDNKALELNGSDAFATMSQVPVDTSGSFTVTAWARATAKPRHSVALIGADGALRSAVEIRYLPGNAANPADPGYWEVAVADKDSVNPVDKPVVKRVKHTAGFRVDAWTHLALVYDGHDKELRLYVNGSLQEHECADTDGDGKNDDSTCVDLLSWTENALVFTAGKSLLIGRARNETSGKPFPGLIDDVWVFQGALSGTQVEMVKARLFDAPTEVPTDI